MDFGSVGVISADIDATSEIKVQCTSGTPYTLSLNVGTGGGSITERLMSGPSSNTIKYSLYTDFSRTNVWGDDMTGVASPGTGTGAEEAHTVYGRVPAQSTPEPGTYSSIVTATITY